MADREDEPGMLRPRTWRSFCRSKMLSHIPRLGRCGANRFFTAVPDSAWFGVFFFFFESKWKRKINEAFLFFLLYFFCATFHCRPSSPPTHPRGNKPFWEFNLFRKIVQNPGAMVLPGVAAESLCREFF